MMIIEDGQKKHTMGPTAGHQRTHNQFFTSDRDELVNDDGIVTTKPPFLILIMI
jgi:hypothetical protein